jgi:hypothetical protein
MIQDEAIKCRFCKEMLDTFDNADEPAPTPHDAEAQISASAENKFDRTTATKPSIKNGPLLVAFALSIILFLGLHGASAWNRNKYENYKSNASQAVNALEKIDAATETGINYLNYSEKVAETNYSIRLFKERYAGKREGSYRSYSAILSAFESYAAALDKWQTYISNMRFYDDEISPKYEVQSSWRNARASLNLAKSVLSSEWLQLSFVPSNELSDPTPVRSPDAMAKSDILTTNSTPVAASRGPDNKNDSHTSTPVASSNSATPINGKLRTTPTVNVRKQAKKTPNVVARAPNCIELKSFVGTVAGFMNGRDLLIDDPESADYRNLEITAKTTFKPASWRPEAGQSVRIYYQESQPTIITRIVKQEK